MPEFTIRFQHLRHHTKFEVTIFARTDALAREFAWDILRRRVAPRSRSEKALADWTHLSTTELPAHTSLDTMGPVQAESLHTHIDTEDPT